MQSVQKQDGNQQVNLIAEARVLLSKLPERQCAKSTQKLYGRIFKRMWAEEKLDPLRAGDARDT